MILDVLNSFLHVLYPLDEPFHQSCRSTSTNYGMSINAGTYHILYYCYYLAWIFRSIFNVLDRFLMFEMIFSWINEKHMVVFQHCRVSSVCKVNSSTHWYFILFFFNRNILLRCKLLSVGAQEIFSDKTAQKTFLSRIKKGKYNFTKWRWTSHRYLLLRLGNGRPSTRQSTAVKLWTDSSVAREALQWGAPEVAERRRCRSWKAVVCWVLLRSAAHRQLWGWKCSLASKESARAADSDFSCFFAV